jgi:hypothetical protein
MATVIEELAISLGWQVDAKPLTEASEKSKRQAKESADSWRKSAAVVASAWLDIGKAVAGAVGKVVGFIDEITKAGDKVAKNARAAGMAADSYQRLQFIAGRSGVEMNVVSVAARKLGKNLLDASNGGGKMFTDTIAQMGVSLSDLEGLKPEEQIGLIADALLKVEDPARRSAMSMNLFGEEGGPKMASLLALGSKGIKDLGEKAKGLGLIMGKDALDASEEFQDQLGDLKATVAGVARDLGVSLIPMLKDFIVQIREWITQNRELIQTKLQDFIKDVAHVVRELLPVALSLVGAIGKLVDVVGPQGAAGAFGALKLATSGVGTSMMAALGPIGMVTAAVAALSLALIGSVEDAQKSRMAMDDYLRGGTTSKRGAPGFVASKEEGKLQARKRKWLDAAAAENAKVRNLDLSPAARTQAKMNRDSHIARAKGIDDKIAAERSRVEESRQAEEATDANPQGPPLAAMGSTKPPRTGGGRGSKRKPFEGPDLSELEGHAAMGQDDPGLNLLLGSVGISSSPMDELGLKETPQVLINTTNNTFTQSFEIDIDGAGDPGSVADSVVVAFKRLMSEDLQDTSKMAKVVFSR